MAMYKVIPSKESRHPEVYKTYDPSTKQHKSYLNKEWRNLYIIRALGDLTGVNSEMEEILLAHIF